ncbi:MAG: hypothetical protein IPK79_11130 [Vampirovibrionales bacterium]|nr:hypothetical protein [Vampirovibrionales bacterium]
MILIIGTEDDALSVFMRDKIRARGLSAFMLDTMRYPRELRVSFDPQTPSNGWIRSEAEGVRVGFDEILGGYRRWSKGVWAPQEADPMLQEIVYWNNESALGSFLRCLDCLWINSAAATDLHRYKAYQLKLLKQAGVRVPKTLVSNDPEAVRAFFDDCGGEAIYKPVRGWAHAARLTVADLTPERLQSLSLSPAKFQELIPGCDIRAYWLMGEMFAMEIQSQTLDFREDEQARRVRVDLPTEALAMCQTIANTLDLAFTGIDLRRTPQGEYVAFEANPTPLFLRDEYESGYPISDRIIDHLAQAGR